MMIAHIFIFLFLSHPLFLSFLFTRNCIFLSCLLFLFTFYSNHLYSYHFRFTFIYAYTIHTAFICSSFSRKKRSVLNSQEKVKVKTKKKFKSEKDVCIQVRLSCNSASVWCSKTRVNLWKLCSANIWNISDKTMKHKRKYEKCSIVLCTTFFWIDLRWIQRWCSCSETFRSIANNIYRMFLIVLLSSPLLANGLSVLKLYKEFARFLESFSSKEIFIEALIQTIYSFK